MKMPWIFRRTITITSVETWTISVESLQPPDAAQLSLGSDRNPADEEQVDAEQSALFEAQNDVQPPATQAIECDPNIKTELSTQQ